MPTTITKNRIARYHRLAAEGAAPRVFNRDRSSIGYVIAWGPDYAGEAGFSRRLRVLWSDGATTLCTTRGMIPSMEDSTVLGGYREWEIR